GAGAHADELDGYGAGAGSTVFATPRIAPHAPQQGARWARPRRRGTRTGGRTSTSAAGAAAGGDTPSGAGRRAADGGRATSGSAGRKSGQSLHQRFAQGRAGDHRSNRKGAAGAAG